MNKIAFLNEITNDLKHTIESKSDKDFKKNSFVVLEKIVQFRVYLKEGVHNTRASFAKNFANLRNAAHYHSKYNFYLEKKEILFEFQSLRNDSAHQIKYSDNTNISKIEKLFYEHLIDFYSKEFNIVFPANLINYDLHKLRKLLDFILKFDTNELVEKVNKIENKEADIKYDTVGIKDNFTDQIEEVFFKHSDDPETALKAFKVIIEQNTIIPDYIIFYYTGLCKLKLKNYNEAIGDFTKCINEQPNVEYFIRRAGTYYLIDNLDASIEDYTNALIYSNDQMEKAMLYKDRGDCYYYKENYEKAILDYSKSVTLYPNNNDLILRMAETEIELYNNSKAYELLNGLLLNDPENIEALLTRGELKYDLDDFEGAINDLSNAIKLGSNDYYGHIWLIKSFIAIGDYEKGLKYANIGIELLPNKGYGYFYKGYCEYHLNMYEQAVANLTKCSSLEPTFARAYECNANAKMELDDLYGAEEDITKAIELDPEEFSYYFLRGTIKVNNNDYEGAISDFKMAIKLNQDDINSYLEISYSFYRLNKGKEAIRYAKKVIYIEPDNFRALQLIIWQYYEDKDYEEVINYSSRALRIKPNYPSLYYQRSRARFNIAEYANSLDDINIAIELPTNKPNPDFYSMRGFIKERLGDKIGAKDDFKIANSLRDNIKK